MVNVLPRIIRHADAIYARGSARRRIESHGIGREESSFRCLLIAIGMMVFPGIAYSGEASIDWKALEHEAVSLLRRYIQIDTTNPPGNEIKAAQFFKDIFDREGIESKIIEVSPGRANIYARLRGNGSKKGVVLLNHMDVVPAEAKLWKELPFGGALKDGVIWGRGSLDNKGPAIIELMTLLTLKRHKIPLKADVIFIGT